MKKLINIFNLKEIAEKQPDSTIVKFAIRHSYILGELEAGIEIITVTEPLSQLIILNKGFHDPLNEIKRLTENRFDDVVNYIVVPMKKTFIGSTNTAKQIKFVRDLTESQLKVYDRIKFYQIKGEFIEISEQDSKEKFN